jgi:dephospho-CoA kinase
MIKVGVTGGIGTGKSTVCKIFESLGIPVYYADQEARSLSDHHPEIIKGVKDLFGSDIYADNQLNRKKVGELVFANKQLLASLNQIIHPVVAQHFEHWLQINAAAPYVMKEAAILFESGAYKQVDKIITVTSPKELRLARVMQRDQLSREEVEQRMLNQMDEVEKIRQSDFVINNNDIDLLVTQVLQVHNALLKR